MISSASAPSPDVITGSAPRAPDILPLRTLGRIVAALAVIWVALIAMTAAGWMKLDDGNGSTSMLFVWWAIFAFVPLWMAVRPSPRAGALSASAALGLTALLGLAAPQLWPYTPLPGSGLACLGALTLHAIRAPATHRARSRYALLIGLLTCLYVLLSGFPLSWSAQSSSHPMDFLTYAGDEALGGQLSQSVETLFLASPLLAQLCFHVYHAMALGLAATIAWQIAVHERPARAAVLTFFIAGALGHVFYTLFPVIGPRFLFGLNGPLLSTASVFPSVVPSSAALVMPAVIPGVPRNCMPSLHTAWALLVFWQSRSLGRWGKALGALFLVLTALATLGFALHYLVDLIAAVPFAVAIQAYFTPRSSDIERERLQALVAGGLGFLAWMLLLRFGTSLLLSSTVLAWALAAVVCIPALVLEGRLYRRLSA